MMPLLDTRHSNGVAKLYLQVLVPALASLATTGILGMNLWEGLCCVSLSFIISFFSLLLN